MYFVEEVWCGFGRSAPLANKTVHIMCHFFLYVGRLTCSTASQPISEEAEDKILSESTMGDSTSVTIDNLKRLME